MRTRTEERLRDLEARMQAMQIGAAQQAALLWATETVTGRRVLTLAHNPIDPVLVFVGGVYQEQGRSKGVWRSGRTLFFDWEALNSVGAPTTLSAVVVYRYSEGEILTTAADVATLAAPRRTTSWIEETPPLRRRAA